MTDTSTALEVVRETPVEVHRQGFGHEQIELIKRTICNGATDDELALFVKVAERTGLDPFARQIHAVKRWDSDKGMNVMSIQVGIDGFRLIAERTHRYAGRLGPYWCGEDGEWLMDDKGRPRPWLRAEPPSAAMVGVRHRDYVDPLYAIATWKSYVQTKKGGAVTHMWATKGDLMLGKCAEALALRGAFPAELSGLYTDDEMGQAHVTVNEPPPPPAPMTDGWDTAEQEYEAHREISARLAQLPEDHPVRIAGRVMREIHGWPVALERLAELRDLLDEAERAPLPHQDDEKAPSAPEPADTPDAPSLPLPEPEKPKPSKRGGPVVKCAWCGNDIKDEAAVPVIFEDKSRVMHGKCKTEWQEEQTSEPAGTF